MLRTRLSVDDFEERRASERITVALPATLALGPQKYTAKLVNIMCRGAMLEVSVPLLTRSRVVLNCGTISADAVVVWNKGNLLGLKFKCPISEAQVNEQISRCEALQQLRSRNPGNAGGNDQSPES